jgi:hypothetical protein
MTARAFLRIALLGFLVFALAPGLAVAAGQGQDLTEMLASSAAAQATAVSGPIISASPLSLNFGTVDNGTTGMLTLNIANTGDQPLNISAMNYSDAAYSSATPGSIAAGANMNVTVSFHPNDGASHTGSLTIMSNASNGSQTVLLTGQANAPPTLDPIGDKAVAAFTTLTFTVTGSDNNDTIDDNLSFSMGAGLPPSATFNTSTGAFSWAPTGAEAGAYMVTFSVSDGRLTASETIHIAVTVTNHPPVANAGGTYFGATNRPLTFNGTGSSDPDAGQTLTFAWDFGDGATGSGATPAHTYLIPGNFVATLRVTDNGTPALSDDDFAAVTIQTEIGAQVILENGSSTLDARKTGNRTTKVGLEEVLVPYTSLIPSSIALSAPGAPAGFVTSCPADTRFFVFGDMDADGVTDIDVRFTNKCLANLFNNTPNNSTQTVVITGLFSVPGGTIPLHAERSLTIQAKHRVAPILAIAYPNPFNPETAISYSVSNNGPVTMRIYAIDGRLVRTLKNGESTVAGTYEVRWNGVNDQGRHVPSGIYFVKTSQRTGATEAFSVFKVALTK